jgi:hypothetical protein
LNFLTSGYGVKKKTNEDAGELKPAESSARPDET